MRGKAPCCCLQHQTASSQTEIMNCSTIWFVVALKVEFCNTQYQHRGSSCPSLISFDQTRKHTREFLSILFFRDDKTPGLLVIRGSCPTGCFKQRSQILVANGSIRKAVRAPPGRYQIVYGVISGSIHSSRAQASTQRARTPVRSRGGGRKGGAESTEKKIYHRGTENAEFGKKLDQ